MADHAHFKIKRGSEVTFKKGKKEITGEVTGYLVTDEDCFYQVAVGDDKKYFACSTVNASPSK